MSAEGNQRRHSGWHDESKLSLHSKIKSRNTYKLCTFSRIPQTTAHHDITSCEPHTSYVPFRVFHKQQHTMILLVVNPIILLYMDFAQLKVNKK